MAALPQPGKVMDVFSGREKRKLSKWALSRKEHSGCVRGGGFHVSAPRGELAWTQEHLWDPGLS